MCTAPMACYLSGYLLETKEDNFKVGFYLSFRRYPETVNLSGHKYLMLFLTARDSSREPSLLQRGTSSASTHNGHNP